MPVDVKGNGTVEVGFLQSDSPIIDIHTDSFMPTRGATAKELSVVLRSGQPTLDLIRFLMSAKTFRLAIKDGYVDSNNVSSGEEVILEYDAGSNALKINAALTGLNNAGPIYASEATFTETTGAGLYTANITVPAGATLVDIRCRSTALWAATTSAYLYVGDTYLAGGWFDGVNLRALGNLLVGDEISFADPNGKGGPWLLSGYRAGAYSAAARTVIGKVVTLGATGATGVTRMIVLYALVAPTAATKTVI